MEATVTFRLLLGGSYTERGSFLPDAQAWAEEVMRTHQGVTCAHVEGFGVIRRNADGSLVASPTRIPAKIKE